MELMNRRLRSFTVTIIIFLAFCFSCEKPLFVKCSDCVGEEPLTADLVLSLDTKDPSVWTIINIYEGNIEDSVLYKSFEASGSETTTTVALNKHYTVTATYFISGRFYVAVDAAIPKTEYNKDQCDNPCYFVYDNKVNLKLKYTK